MIVNSSGISLYGDLANIGANWTFDYTGGTTSVGGNWTHSAGDVWTTSSAHGLSVNDLIIFTTDVGDYGL